jgi:S1-C subfamily serine protease
MEAQVGAKRRGLLVAGGIVVAIVTVALAAPAVRTMEPGGRVFREAREYTVRIRAQITTPFLEDELGSFQGAGFLVDAERGWIVTNAHVVGQSPSNVEVAFADEDYVPARKLYVDSFADIAVLSIGPTKHTAARLACASDLEIGDAVGVYGHPLGVPFTGTRGIVSNITDQAGMDLIQIDATIDHGNSGGPVIALNDSRIIGIATAGAGGGKADRMNFATPVKGVCRILDLLREGTAPNPPAMRFGLLRDEDERFTMVVANTLDADRWPFEPGDEILGLEGRTGRWRVLNDLVDELRGRTGTVTLRIRRDGKERTIEIKPETRPSIIARRGLVLDGALIAPTEFEDGAVLSMPLSFVVNSVEPGSVAEALDVQIGDLIHTVDGRDFQDLDALIAHVQARAESAPVKMVFCRWSDADRRVFDFHLRELPGDEVDVVGPKPGMALAPEK